MTKPLQPIVRREEPPEVAHDEAEHRQRMAAWKAEHAHWPCRLFKTPDPRVWRELTEDGSAVDVDVLDEASSSDWAGDSDVRRAVLQEARKCSTPARSLLPAKKRSRQLFKPMRVDGDGNVIEHGDPADVIGTAIEAERRHPDSIAKAAISEALQAAHLDHRVRPSVELSRFLWLMRELVHDFRAGETLESMLQQVDALVAMRDGSKGGRPRLTVQHEGWSRRCEDLKRTHPSRTPQERYEDVAAEWNAEHPRRPVTWRGVRKAVTALRKKSAASV